MRYFDAVFQINSHPEDYFAEVFKKLVEKGFVGGDRRCKSVEEIDGYYRRSDYLCIGTDDRCRIVLHGLSNPFTDIPIITVDEFIANHFQAYYDAT